jgi:hypothetical protein
MYSRVIYSVCFRIRWPGKGRDRAHIKANTNVESSPLGVVASAFPVFGGLVDWLIG